MNTIHSLILSGLMAGIVPTCIAESADDGKQANVQLAILLDTSGSMDGLINQARIHIWKIVNEMTLARQNGKMPRIEIALYEYGNNDNSRDWMRQVLPLTGDLDAVSEALFGLKITGSEEYCGTVIRKAVNELTWNTADPNALKMIFIAGNEEFDQGNVLPADAIKEALGKGITVNTIYCGNPQDSDSAGWSTGSRQGDGCFACIDHNAVKADPVTPYDEELAALGTQINGTYLAFGKAHVQRERAARQEAQDAFAVAASPAAMAQRTVVKGKAAYDNKSWDLIDAVKDTGAASVIQELAANDELPEQLRGKSEEEIKALVETKQKEREGMQQKISELNDKRNQWLQDNRKEQVQKESLDDAILKGIREQAVRRQFSFEAK